MTTAADHIHSFSTSQTKSNPSVSLEECQNQSLLPKVIPSESSIGSGVSCGLVGEVSSGLVGGASGGSVDKVSSGSVGGASGGSVGPVCKASTLSRGDV